MTVQRGQPKVAVRVETKRMREMSAGQLLAFADELREGGAPATARVRFDHDSHLGEKLSCSWTEDAAEPPRFVVEGGVPADPEAFGQLRRAAGLTQEALAARTGLGRSSIANLEAGRQDVPLSKLQAYAVAVGAQLVLAQEVSR